MATFRKGEDLSVGDALSVKEVEGRKIKNSRSDSTNITGLKPVWVICLKE